MSLSANLDYVYEDISTLIADLSYIQSGIFNIKPKILFKLIEDNNDNPRNMLIYMPPSGIGSVTLLDSSIIISLMHIMNPKRIFEFGTFLGYSTSLLARNSDKDSHIYSIDIGEFTIDESDRNQYVESEILTDKTINDNYLKFIQSQEPPPYILSLECEYKSKISLLHGDSRNFSAHDNGFMGNIDLVFIDGGHDLETIRIDTENALEMIGKNGVIVWHDYNSQIHDDVTVYLNEFAKSNQIFYVINSLVAFMMVGTSFNQFEAES